MITGICEKPSSTSSHDPFSGMVRDGAYGDYRLGRAKSEEERFSHQKILPG